MYLATIYIPELQYLTLGKLQYPTPDNLPSHLIAAKFQYPTKAK